MPSISATDIRNELCGLFQYNWTSLLAVEHDLDMLTILLVDLLGILCVLRKVFQVLQSMTICS